MSAIIGDLSIVASDGTTLTASTDLALAWAWAEREHGAEAWQAMSYRQRVADVGAALAELRRAFEAAQ